MKNLIIFLAALSALMMSCGHNDNTTRTKIMILVDNTEKCADSKEDMISSQSIVDLIGFHGELTWKQINAVSLNTETNLSLEMPSGATHRKVIKTLEPFVKKLDEQRKAFLGPTAGTENSSIWKPVCESIQELEKSNADNKVLVIVSDMIEFSSNGNFYKSQKFGDVKKHLIDSSGVSLPQNSQVKVIILYNPLGNAKAESKFNRAMEEYWKPLFEEAGIEYEVQPNL